MGDVGGLGRDDDLGVGRHLDVARALAGVGDRHAANLRVVFGGNDDVEERVQLAVAPREGGAIRAEGDGVVVRRSTPLGATPADQIASLSTSRK